jgi:UDP-3-O-[3-hydroxymyristoyl] glucosamine N-acyltransferase
MSVPLLPNDARTLADALDARLAGHASARADRVVALDHTRPGALAFAREPRHTRAWFDAGAEGLLLADVKAVTATDERTVPSGAAILIVPDVDRALSTLLASLIPPRDAPAGTHHSAVVHPAARVDPTAYIGPGCVVERGAIIGARAVLIAQVYVGFEASVGAGALIHPGVRILDRCSVGSRCILHAGVSIGADGFGYLQNAVAQSPGEVHQRVPHAGNVVIGDCVEIGANSCVDRAKFGSTAIGEGTKIDNLVQIAHNCRIGKACILCGGVMLAGSVTIGDGVVLGGGVGVADHVSIGSKTTIAAYSGVSSDVPAGVVYAGLPALPIRDWRRQIASIHRLTRREKPGHA